LGLAGLVFFHPLSASEEIMQSVEALNIPITFVSSQAPIQAGWSWFNGEVYLSGEPLGWIEKFPKNPKEQAELLRGFVQTLPKSLGFAFFVDSQSISIAELKNLKIMVELMGY